MTIIKTYTCESELPASLQWYMDGLRTHDMALLDKSFDRDVTFVTPAKTMHREQILEFLEALYRGFPDWHYDNDPPVHCEDGSIGVLWRQGGTHSADLEFSGFDGVPATGVAVKIPPHFFYYRVSETGVSKIRPEVVEGGAPRGIFEQIGVELPPL